MYAIRVLGDPCRNCLESRIPPFRAPDAHDGAVPPEPAVLFADLKGLVRI